MYKPGELEVAPAGCPPECEEHGHPMDMREADDDVSIGGAFLPHSCEEWVIGGPDQIRALIADLDQALVTLGVNVVDYKIREIVSLREQVANVSQALREAEEQHNAAVATMHVYLRIWLARSGAPWWRFWRRAPELLVGQDELREAANGPPLAFEVQEDGETLRISEVPA